MLSKGTMTEHFNWQEFCVSGAFLRASAQEVWIWSGAQRPSNAGEDENLYLLPFFESSVSAITFEKPPLKIPVFEAIRILEPFLGAQPLTSGHFQPPDRKNYDNSFQFIKGQVQRGEIDKAILVNFSKGPRLDPSKFLAGWMISVLKAAENFFPFGIWNSERGAIGATPEILFRKRGTELKTAALAGTMAKTLNLSPADLIKNPKEMHEHLLVVKDLAKQLGIFGKPTQSPTRVLELPMLYHLITELTVTSLELPGVLDIIKMLHPTAALGVAPRNYGYHWLRNLPEQELRYFHGAPLVFNLPAEQLGLVAIRHLEWNQDQFLIGSGSGIVDASELDQEWAETLLKRQSIFSQLGIKN